MNKFKNSDEMLDFIKKLENINLEEAHKRATNNKLYNKIKVNSSYKEKYLEMQDRYFTLQEAIASCVGSMLLDEDYTT